jgi:hypothetical protein
MNLTAVDTARDFMAVAVGKSERFAMGFNNGGVVDAWFEAHVGILWIRKFFSGRKG